MPHGGWAQRHRVLAALAGFVAVVLIAWLTHQQSGEAGSPSSHATGRSSYPSDLGTVRAADLPPEARDTLQLIARGGPYPFPGRDDTTFTNAEGLLPREPAGYYKEYTVITPGSADRGARRIVAGSGGELYYTDDHYSSFRRIVG